MAPELQLPWLRRWASREPYFQWQKTTRDDRTCYHRPIGLVESLFDSDGRYQEGRADCSSVLTLDVKSDLSEKEFRDHIIDAWTALRIHHLMLRAKALYAHEFLPGAPEGRSPLDVHFVVEDVSESQLRREAVETVSFLSDHHEYVDIEDFWRHMQNTARLINPEDAAAKLIVLPLERSTTTTNRYTLRVIIVASHSCADGLSFHNWMAHFIELVNAFPLSNNDIGNLLLEDTVKKRLPLAQETLYPQVSRNLPRRRWFWAITLVLAHVHRPVPAGMLNPLRRARPRGYGAAIPMTPTYSDVLDYSRTPPINTFATYFMLSNAATKKLQLLCRQAQISIGAGGFALAALACGIMDERRCSRSGSALGPPAPFVSGFPLDPRALFSHKEPPNSMMLAFCEGLVLPILPSSLPLEGRFRLVAKQAHQQLRIYQKRAARTTEEEAEKNPLRVLADNYIKTYARAQARALAITPGPELKNTAEIEEASKRLDPQAAYPVVNTLGRATHGVSSVGSMGMKLRAGRFDLHDARKRFVADYRGMRSGVRARDNEFLAGMAGHEKHFSVGVSYDANYIDEVLVEEWKEVMLHMLEPDSLASKM